MVTVFLVDDHEVVRRGIADLLADENDLSVVGEAATVAEALARVPAVRPDVAIIDLRLPDGDGVVLCRDLRSAMPLLNCLILTSFTDEEAMVDAILAGAGGYVIKDIRGTDLISAIRTVAAGKSILDTHAAAALMARIRADAREPDPAAALTEQEVTVLDLIGEGLTNRQIGERMFLAEKTVKELRLQRSREVGLAAPHADRGVGDRASRPAQAASSLGLASRSDGTTPTTSWWWLATDAPHAGTRLVGVDPLRLALQVFPDHELPGVSEGGDLGPAFPGHLARASATDKRKAGTRHEASRKVRG
jgi:two-component system, NarL family, response regulator DevR